MATPSKQNQLSPWALQAQLWRRELSPSSPLRYHIDHIASAEADAATPTGQTHDTSLGGASSSKRAGARALLGTSEPASSAAMAAAAALAAAAATLHGSAAAADGDISATAHYDRDDDREAAVAMLQAALKTEAGAIVDDLSADRWSLRSLRRRANFLRADVALVHGALSPTPAAGGGSADSVTSPSNARGGGGGGGDGGDRARAAELELGGANAAAAAAASDTPSRAVHTSSRAHGLAAVQSPYKLHAVVSQKDLDKRRRVDHHATSPSMLGRGRVSNAMTDTDLAAYHPSNKTSQKADREPPMLLADTVIAARGGLTPDELNSRKVHRFVERLVNAAEREEGNQFEPPTRHQRWAVEPFSHHSAHVVVENPYTPTKAQRRPGLAQRLLEAQEAHVVDAMATIMLAKAEPVAPERRAAAVISEHTHALSFALSADDRHVLLTALRFAVSDELYPSAAHFSRVIGVARAQAQAALKQLAATFDHWSRLCYDQGGEWPMLKRCLAAVAETPVNWSAKPNTSRAVHFGSVSQRDMEGLLARLRNDESRKTDHPVVERHKLRML